MNNKNKKEEYKGLTVYYTNELARICSKFTLEEEKVIHLIFSQIKPYEKNETTIRLNKLDFFDKLELESGDRYNRYRKLVYGLVNKTFVELKTEQGDELIGVIITASRWNPTKSYFEVNLNNWFMPFLEQLVKNYTKVELDSILKLKSKHALTIYKWLSSWTDENKQINQRYITTKDLKELFGLNIDDYVYNGKFQRKLFENYTIKKALLEINSKANVDVEFVKNKKGNKVQNYEFTWKIKDNDKINNQKQQLKIATEQILNQENETVIELDEYVNTKEIATVIDTTLVLMQQKNPEEYLIILTKKNISEKLKSTLTSLINDYHLDNSVINCLMDYVWFKNNKRLEPNYIIKIAQTFQEDKIYDIEYAIKHLKLAYDKGKKPYQQELQQETIWTSQSEILPTKEFTKINQSAEQLESQNIVLMTKEEMDKILKEIDDY